MPLRVTNTIPIQPPPEPHAAVPALPGLAGPVMLDVPYVRQEQTEWCWAACSQMVAAFFGNSAVKQCELANFLHNQTKCCQKPDSNACNQPAQYDDIGNVYTQLNINCISQNWPVNVLVLHREFA